MFTDASLEQNERSFSATNEHYKPNQAQQPGNGQTYMHDGKEVELHIWDGSDDPDNPFAALDIVQFTRLTVTGSTGHWPTSGSLQ